MPLQCTLVTDDNRLSLGIEGADEVLSGGLLPAQSYMLRGGAGTGKTVLGFHYLTAGVEAGEDCLFVAFEESADDIRGLRITEGGLLVGDPPEEPRGVLTGAPEGDDD
jgi:circadian clock protein KaiC